MEEAIEDKNGMGETVSNAAGAGETPMDMGNAMGVAGEKKDYKKVFYGLFAANLLVNVTYYYGQPGLLLNGILLVVEIVLFYLWCKNFNEAWKLIGKKHGWLWGLVLLVPFGVIVCLLVAESTLRKAGYWTGSGSFKLSK